MPEFSIIVPVYNRITFLEDALASCLDQTHTDFEVILVDDGSQEQIARDLDLIADQNPHFQVIHKDMNEGVSAARNTGIVHARGEFFIFLDDDDQLVPDMLQRTHDFFTQYPEVHILACKGTALIDDEMLWDQGNFLRQGQVNDANTHLHWLETSKKSMYFLMYYPLVNAFAYRKEVFLHHRFPPELPVSSGEDTYLWFELSKGNYVFKVVPWYGAYYRLHGLESTTSVQTIDHRLLFWKALEQLATSREEHLFVKKARAGLLLAKKDITWIQYFRVVLRFPFFYLKLMWLTLRRRLRAKAKYRLYRWRKRFGS